MQLEFSGQYYRQVTSIWGASPVGSVRDVVLTDDNLVRGDGANESASGLFDGVRLVNLYPAAYGTLDDGEVLTTVTFGDGTALVGVRALYDGQTGAYGYLQEQFLLDLDRLEAFGKTLADVVHVDVTALTDHDLSWADFGFAATGVVTDPEPEPEPVLNLVQGTSRDDTLSGTAGDDLIIGGNGSDRLTGGAGEDTFVFGADARDGNRDRDVITDFNAAQDSIVLEFGVQVRNFVERNGNLVVTLDTSDRDVIVVQRADSSILSNFSVVDDSVLG